MRKKILAMLLAVALVASLAVPASTTNANAAEYNPYHCECGAQQFESAEATEPKDPTVVCADGCGEEKNLTWKPLATYVTNGEGKHVLPSDGENYYLVKNFEVDYPTYLQKNLRIDLNGHTISRPKHKIIQVEQGGSLVITDTSASKNGTMDVNAVTNTKQVGNIICMKGASSLKLLAGTLDASDISIDDTTVKGGAVYVEGSSSFDMYGGTIYGGRVDQGGAVFVTGASATFTMHDGLIVAGNNVRNGGGAVFVTSNANFTMHDGEITAAGKTGSYGMCVCAYNGTFNLYDGTLTGGTATGSGGGVMSLADSGKVNMYGGTIQNGTHKNANTTHGGGNVRISSGCTLNMYGGTITGGTATNGQGGGVYVLGTLLVAGDARITGNTGSNVWLGNGKTITLGTPAFTANASIGITMQTPGTFVSSGATAQKLACFSADADGYYVALDGAAMKLTNELGTNEALIGDSLYTTVEKAMEAITNREKQTVKLATSRNEDLTISGDLYLDLNGKTFSGDITINNGTLKVSDSMTADYDVSDDVYGKITGTVTGNIARSSVNPDNQRYLVVKTDEGYSAHRIYLAVTHSVLENDNYSAMNYKTVFVCDEVIAKLVSDYGVTVKAEQERDYSYGTSITIDAWNGIRNNEKTTKIENFLIAGDAENKKCAETLIEVNAYITLKDQLAGNITSASKTRSLKQMIEDVLATQWDEKLLVSQKKTLKQMYNTYNQDDFMDSWSGMGKVKQYELTSKNSIASVGYAAVNIDPIEGMFEGQENPVGLLGMGDENSRWITKVDPNAPLMAICLAVTDQDGNTVLLISVDAAGINDKAAQRVVTGITALGYGVKEGSIMIASNHQHSTPNFTPAYSNYFVSQVVEGARLALEDRKEVIGMTAQIVEVGENTFNFVRNVQYTDASGKPIPGAMKTDNHDDKNRGISYSGKTYESTADDDVQLVKITRVGDEQPIILANFQTHPHLSVDSANKNSDAYHTATADIIGVFRNKLAQELNCKPMYFTGSSGNINAWSQIDSSKEKADLNYITQGEKLALAVKNGIQESAWISVVSESTGGVAVKTVTREYGVMLNSVPTWLTSGKTMDQIVAHAANFWNEEDGYLKNTTADDLKTYGIYSKYHAKYIIQRSTNNATDTKSITISVITIGDLAFVVAPYEMYDTNGMQIKAAFPDKVVFTTQQADMPTSNRVKMSNGYIPSALSYANGGYSVDIATFAAGTGEKLAEDYIYILNQLYN